MSSYLMRVILIPSSVFLSVMFGGAFGSGQEVVQFMSGHGPYGGIVSMITIGLVYAICLFLCFEFARKFKAYDYRSFFKVLLNKGWFCYEILIMLGLVVALAICATAAGTIAKDHFGYETIYGSAALLMIVVVLNYLGRKYVESSMIYSVVALAIILIYLFFDVMLDDNYRNIIVTKFAEDTLTQQTFLDSVFTGLKYGFSNSGFIPLVIYCAIQLKTRKEAFIAACIAGYVAISPAISFHTIFMIGYPEIVGQELPSYWILEKIESALFIDLYVSVVFIMIAQTGVGLLQGFVERIDSYNVEKRGKKLSSFGHALVSTVLFFASIWLASIGLMNLVAKGYTFFSASFFIFFFIPLFSYGVYLIFLKKTQVSEQLVLDKTQTELL
ncbi:hypothetical protein RI845_10870 [Thalassotalea nanhaiensis]|uniref:Membrane protein YkvI n=1 Tax=Thalassotalea nanhaiensis TaxID=3065648 RepID=A0ABY9TE58_9GAMM|nr:hypothetical protein RI845_10870 [Colwelliaceae bacterium SQ345]